MVLNFRSYQINKLNKQIIALNNEHVADNDDNIILKDQKDFKNIIKLSKLDTLKYFKYKDEMSIIIPSAYFSFNEVNERDLKMILDNYIMILPKYLSKILTKLFNCKNKDQFDRTFMTDCLGQWSFEFENICDDEDKPILAFSINKDDYSYIFALHLIYHMTYVILNDYIRKNKITANENVMQLLDKYLDISCKRLINVPLASVIERIELVGKFINNYNRR